MKHITKKSGTYALILSLSLKTSVIVGRLGTLCFSPGWYTYVGSAMGPGGLDARVGRHLKVKKRAHWHIDYLRPLVRVVGAFVVADRQIKECEWASQLTQTPLTGIPVKGVGSSDCKCPAHLLYHHQSFDPSIVARLLRAKWIAVC